MNPYIFYLFSLLLTLVSATLLTFLLKAALEQILVELCGTRERANFWTRFTMLMLIGMPMVIGLGYSPVAASGQEQFFEMARQLRGNLMGFLFALGVMGLFLLFFTLVTPRAKSSN